MKDDLIVGAVVIGAVALIALRKPISELTAPIGDVLSTGNKYLNLPLETLGTAQKFAETINPNKDNGKYVEGKFKADIQKIFGKDNSTNVKNSSNVVIPQATYITSTPSSTLKNGAPNPFAFTPNMSHQSNLSTQGVGSKTFVKIQTPQQVALSVSKTPQYSNSLTSVFSNILKR